MSLNVIILHDKMLNKQQELVTTSLTLIDIHDIARSSRTYGANHFFVAHPSAAIRKLAHTLQDHWSEGFGSTYNPNRKEALDHLSIVSDLDEAIMKLEMEYKVLPTLIATSAKEGSKRVSFKDMSQKIAAEDKPYLLMLGTGWGMSDELLNRAEYFLEPVKGAGEYNHLSVRSACAIMLDRFGWEIKNG